MMCFGEPQTQPRRATRLEPLGMHVPGATIKDDAWIVVGWPFQSCKSYSVL